jgi:hypothetical protein
MFLLETAAGKLELQHSKQLQYSQYLDIKAVMQVNFSCGIFRIQLKLYFCGKL